MRKRATWWGALTLLLQACSGLKYATEEHPLFAGYKVVFTERPVTDAKAAMTELENVVTPQPNTTFLGMRPSVALHNMVSEPKKPGKGLKHKLKYVLGSPPVYLADVPLADIDAALVNRMNNRGYFGATASHEVVRRRRTARVTFTVDPGRPHLLDHIAYGDTARTSREPLVEALREQQAGSSLHAGEPYSLQQLIDERRRVAGRLRNRGFIRLEDDALEFAADTASGDHRTNLLLRVKSDASPRERRQYVLGRVRVHGDHDPLLSPNDTIAIDSLIYINYLNMYRPGTITRGVFLRPGEPASERRVQQTRQYLSSYGVFKDVRVSLTDDSTQAAVLNADVILVPQERFSLFSEVNASSKSNNFAGPGLKVGWKDRDLFRGAEVLTIDLKGSFETQFSGDGKGTDAYEVGIKAGLAFPRLLLLNKLRAARTYAPMTHIGVGYGLFRRIGLYGMETASMGYGYSWRQDRSVWHDVALPEISYNNLYYASDEFLEFLGENPQIRRSFEEQFILGTGYTYTRSTQRGNTDLSWWLTSLGVDESGNLTSLIFRGVDGPRPDEGYLLFGERYSQYVRFRPEVRWFQQAGRRGSQWASRLKAGLAVPYGNSSTIPYVKQFFSGGTNSLRAFRARSVGPGTYSPELNTGGEEASTNLLVDQVGDILFEANLEYRFTISGAVKGALFGDAGNVWLLHDDPQRPGGKFEFDQALSELAVGAGFGLRYDPGVIVIRLDLAAPMRRPDLPAGDRWVFDDPQPDFTDNFILNFAIGYPF